MRDLDFILKNKYLRNKYLKNKYIDSEEYICIVNYDKLFFNHTPTNKDIFLSDAFSWWYRYQFAEEGMIEYKFGTTKYKIPNNGVNFQYSDLLALPEK